MAFLHEKKITHGDIRSENMVMDIIFPDTGFTPLAGLYGPERKYAYIDFEWAILSADDGEGSPQFRKATIEDLNSLAFTVEVNLRVSLFYVYYF